MNVSRRAWRWAAAATVALGVLLSPAAADAAGSLTIGEAAVRAGETHTGDLSVTIGKLAVDGQVTGTVRNSLGSTVVRGTVGGDAVSSLGEIQVESGGQVAGDVSTTAGAIVVRGDVGGDVTSSAGEVSIGGRVAGDVAVETGTVVISGEVGGDVRVRAGFVRLQNGADVKGGVYVEEGWVERSPGAAASSVQVSRERPGWTGGRHVQEGLAGHDWRQWRLPSQFWWFANVALSGLGRLGRSVVLMLVGMAVLALFPGRLPRMADQAAAQPGRSFGLGLLGLVSLPVVVVLLAISILGILLIPFVVFGAALLWLLGHLTAALAVGRAIALRAASPGQEPWHEFAQLGMGLLVLAAVGFVPVLGWLAAGVAATAGLGAVLLSRGGKADGGGAAGSHP